MSDAPVVAPGFTYTGLDTVGNRYSELASGSVTHKRDIDLTSASVARLIDRSGNIGADGTTVWLSFIFRMDANANSYGLVNWYRDGSEIGGVGDDAVGDGTTNNNYKISGVSEIVNTVRSVSVQTFILVKIDFNTGDDDVTVWFDPVIANGETGLDTPDLLSVSAKDQSFDQLAVRFCYAEGNSGTMDVDEIRLGTTLESVTPIVMESTEVTARETDE